MSRLEPAPRAVYSRRLDAYRDVCPDPEVYLAPRARIPLLRPLVRCPLTAIEDLDDTPTWLWLNEVVRDGTRMVYDRTARYSKVESDRGRRLSRLAEVGRAHLVDLTPFCEDVRALYLPWRYVCRTVLGYTHYYAFSGGHAEEVDGRIVSALDPGLLAGKIAPFCAGCEPRTLAERKTVPLRFTPAEHQEYARKREELFARYRTPQPILTRLADLSHGFETRRSTATDLLRPGDAVVCNMDAYARRYRERVPGVRAGTYAKPPRGLEECSRLVLAEPPIVQTYHRWDLEAVLPEGAEVVELVGDCKVDRFLCGRIEQERADIDAFMEGLRARLSTEERARRRA